MNDGYDGQTRVSGLMTNAPFIMNVDCDMHVNNPQVILHAMCMLLGVKNETDCAYVQFAQCFYDGLRDDPFGNQMVVMNEVSIDFSKKNYNIFSTIWTRI